MVSTTEIIIALFSGAVVALVSAIIFKVNVDKKNAVDNITQERKKWRNDLHYATVAIRKFVQNTPKGNYLDGELRFIFLEESFGNIEKETPDV